MSPAFPARRRADEFHRLVEARSSSDAVARPGDDATGELDRLVGLATDLRDLPAVEPSAEFTASLRERLMAAAATELAPTATDDAVARKLTVRSLSGSSTTTRRRRRYTAAVAALLVVGGTAGAAVASQGTLPGDALYPVKRAVENVRTGFSVSDRSKGSTLLSDADTRLDEVHRLTRTGRSADTDTVRSTLESFSSQATEASDLLIGDYKHSKDPKSIKGLRTFAAQGITRLSELQGSVPEDAQQAVGEAAQTLLLIDQAAQALCPSCGPGIVDLPQNLLRTVSQTLGDTATDLGLTGQVTGTSGGSGLPIALPSVDPGKLPPGSTSGSGQGATGSTGGQTSGGQTSGGQTSGGSSSGDTGSDSTGTTLGDTVGGLLGGSGGSTSGSDGSDTSGDDPTSKPSTQLGDTVGGVVDGVTGTVGGLLGGVGGLLGGPTPTP